MQAPEIHNELQGFAEVPRSLLRRRVVCDVGLVEGPADDLAKQLVRQCFVKGHTSKDREMAHILVEANEAKYRSLVDNFDYLGLDEAIELLAAYAGFIYGFKLASGYLTFWTH